MACGCDGNTTRLNGSLLIEDSTPLGKLKWPTGAFPPAKKNYPISWEYFEKRLVDLPTGGVSGVTPYVNFNSYGGVGKTGPENKAAMYSAISDAMTSNIRVVQLGAGTYIFEPMDLSPEQAENVTIQGVGPGTRLQMDETLGDGVFKLRGTTGVIIRQMTLDIEDSAATGAGGIWVSGISNIVEDVTCLNGDGFSICVIGSYSNGSGFVPTPTEDNIVRRCIISGQRRYHSIGAKAGLLVAEAATRTLCEDILLVDNFMSGETGDYAGNDHGLYTTFRNITCLKTSEGNADGAALHLEGGEDYDDMYVTVENLTAINFTVGTSVSEKSKATYTGHNKVVNCKYAIKSYGIHTSRFTNFEIIDCGAGLEAIDTEGVITNAKSGIYENIRTSGTLAKCAFVNYNADAFDSTGVPVDIINCEFDKIVQCSYTNVGSYWVNISGGRLLSTNLGWYNNVGLRVNIDNVYFYRSTINGYRSDTVRVHSCTFENTGTGTAITCSTSTDDDKVFVNNCFFKSYTNITNGGPKLGAGNLWATITNPPPAYDVDALAFTPLGSLTAIKAAATGTNRRSFMDTANDRYYAYNPTTGKLMELLTNEITLP